MWLKHSSSTVFSLVLSAPHRLLLLLFKHRPGRHSGQWGYSWKIQSHICTAISVDLPWPKSRAAMAHALHLNRDWWSFTCTQWYDFIWMPFHWGDSISLSKFLFTYLEALKVNLKGKNLFISEQNVIKNLLTNKS